MASDTSALPRATELQCRFDLIDERAAGGDAGPLRSKEAGELLADLCSALEDGTLRVVWGDGMGRWRVQGWVKRALMRLSAAGSLQLQPGALPGRELDTLGWREDRPEGCRIPAGSFLRRGAFVGPGAAIMPPSTVQAGAAVLAGASVDSHVLLGSAVLVGEGAVVGCGTMLAGALLPEDALSVVLERGVVVGGSCGLYGPLVVGEQSAIYAGTVIRAAAGVFHAGRQEWMMPDRGGTLRLPPGAVVSMGVPPADAFADGIQRLAPLLSD